MRSLLAFTSWTIDIFLCINNKNSNSNAFFQLDENVSRAMCRTSGAGLGLAKGTFPAQGFSFPQPPDDTKRPLRRRKRGMLKEATILDKIDGKFIPHLSSKMVRFSFRVVCYTAVFSVVTQRPSPSVTTLKTAV